MLFPGKSRPVHETINYDGTTIGIHSNGNQRIKTKKLERQNAVDSMIEIEQSQNDERDIIAFLDRFIPPPPAHPPPQNDSDDELNVIQFKSVEKQNNLYGSCTVRDSNQSIAAEGIMYRMPTFKNCSQRRSKKTMSSFASVSISAYSLSSLLLYVELNLFFQSIKNDFSTLSYHEDKESSNKFASKPMKSKDKEGFQNDNTSNFIENEEFHV